MRSAVEREFITIGEAVNVLGRVAPHVYEQITEARLIVGFREFKFESQHLSWLMHGVPWATGAVDRLGR